MTSQYHEGEREAQRLAGETEIAEAREGIMQPRIAAGATRWLQAQTLLAIASLDTQGRPWATVLTGTPGFLHAESGGSSLWIDHAVPFAVQTNLATHPQIGLLAIDLTSRQRMRINGTAECSLAGLHVTVDESFFNCPKYITRRFAIPSAEGDSNAVGSEGCKLQGEHLRLLHETDVLFVATTHPEHGLDVSHRGGDAGFVQLLPDGRIRIPDYAGNSLFNTLGNLLIDPRIGLAIPNLRTGRILQITGTAAIAWRDADPENSTGGTHRFIDMTPEAWRMTSGGPVAGAIAEPSPYNPHTI